MLDFLRNLRKSESEREQERLTAYLDGELTPAEQATFEDKISQDIALQTKVEQQQLIKENLQRLPYAEPPHNFTLDPAVYGRQQQSTLNPYLVLRTATLLTALLLIFLVLSNLLTSQAILDEMAAIPVTRVVAPVADDQLFQESAAEEAADGAAASNPNSADESDADEGGESVETDRATVEEPISPEMEGDVVEEEAAQNDTAVADAPPTPTVTGTVAVSATSVEDTAVGPVPTATGDSSPAPAEDTTDDAASDTAGGAEATDDEAAPPPLAATPTIEATDVPADPELAFDDDFNLAVTDEAASAVDSDSQPTAVATTSTDEKAAEQDDGLTLRSLSWIVAFILIILLMATLYVRGRYTI